ncbi:MAG: phosphoenolpyruvate-utilizing N-terminal domain-containing protein, partial [Lentisphaeria bacterium]
MSEWPKAKAIFEGNNSSFGIAFGVAILLEKKQILLASHSISSMQIPNEIARFEHAVKTTCKELEQQKKLNNLLGESPHASIIDAHILLANDPIIHDKVIHDLHSRKVNIEQVYSDITSHFTKMMEASSSEDMRLRAEDIFNVSEMVLANLASADIINHKALSYVNANSIVIAKSLTPSELIEIANAGAKGFVTEEGSANSHTAIMAKSIQLPGILGLENATSLISNGSNIIIDGVNNKMFIEPSSELFEEYKVLQKNFLLKNDEEKKLIKSVHKTKDNEL